jgi:hypothetical protein
LGSFALNAGFEPQVHVRLGRDFSGGSSGGSWIVVSWRKVARLDSVEIVYLIEMSALDGLWRLLKRPLLYH